MSLVSNAIYSILMQNADKFFKIDFIIYDNDSGRSSKLFQEVVEKSLREFSSKVTSASTFSTVLDNSSVLLG